MSRIITLADFNLDYSNLNDTFKDLTKLAAKVTSSPISMVNIIDNYTVWTISSYGIDVQQTPREESICQYTILEKDQFAVNDLSVDPIFKEEGFVTGDAHFRFYHGVPLAADQQNLGALCVMDLKAKSLDAEKVEMLRIIGDEIINRMKTYRYIETLRNNVQEAKQTRNKLSHDIRGPIAGIMGLADIVSMKGEKNNLDEVLEFIGLIHKGGKSLLELADEILSEEKRTSANKGKPGEMMLQTFKKRLIELYTPQARAKNIEFRVDIRKNQEELYFPQNKLMQIAGNLVSNAIKFTPKFGDVTVTLDAESSETESRLLISVKDTGAGIEEAQIALLLADNTESTDGTDGEKGYGFGLALVKHLVKGLNGTFNITSGEGSGAQFDLSIPFKV